MREHCGKDQEEGPGGELLLALLAGAGLFLAVATVVIPNLFRARCCLPGQLMACKSNLKNIGLAMEAYSTDWNGNYPRNPGTQLVPNYLRAIPQCPSAGTDTYTPTFQQGPSATYNTQSRKDYYFVYCQGHQHSAVNVAPNYPQYNDIVGP